MFVVYMSSGQYSDYGVEDRPFLVGDTDPEPLVNAFVAHHSGGLWNSWEDMYRLPTMGEDRYGHPVPIYEYWDNGPMSAASAASAATKARIDGLLKARWAIQKAIPDHLKEHGFREARGVELWGG